MTQPDSMPGKAPKLWTPWHKLVVGVGQAIVLALLIGLAQMGDLPPTTAPLLAALTLVLFLVPLLVVEGLGNLAPRALWLWGAAATVILAGLGVWDRLRLYIPPVPVTSSRPMWALLPSPGIVMVGTVLVVIGQIVVGAWAEKERVLAPYATYFAHAIRLCREALLSGVFVAACWLILTVTARLFGLIALFGLSRIMVQPAFAVPVSTFGAVLGLILGRPRVTAIGAFGRGLLLQVAWLLPLACLAAIVFLISVAVTGLDRVWQNARASAVLLALAAGLIVLINVLWQSGKQNDALRPVLRHAGTLAAALVLPVVAVAVYALSVQVEAYGFSVRRVLAGAALAVTAVFGVGYLLAAWRGLRRDQWLDGLGAANMAGTLALVAVLLLVYSPLADPARIAVASQLARLESGRVSAQQFDFSYLASQGAGFGHRALLALTHDAEGPQAALIRVRAEQALQGTLGQMPELTALQRAAQLRIFPGYYPLPSGVARQAWTGSQGVPPCLVEAGHVCDVFPAELTGHPPDQLILAWGGPQLWQTVVLGMGSTSRWRIIGTFGGLCRSTVAALRKGLYAVVAPVVSYRTLEVDGRDLNVQPVMEQATSCAGRAGASVQSSPGGGSRP